MNQYFSPRELHPGLGAVTVVTDCCAPVMGMPQGMWCLLQSWAHRVRKKTITCESWWKGPCKHSYGTQAPKGTQHSTGHIQDRQSIVKLRVGQAKCCPTRGPSADQNPVFVSAQGLLSRSGVGGCQLGPCWHQLGPNRHQLDHDERQLDPDHSNWTSRNVGCLHPLFTASPNPLYPTHLGLDTDIWL